MKFSLSHLSAVLLASAFIVSTGGTSAGDTMSYGYQLMTPQERAEHQEKMRSLKTEQEREAYRMEHHKQMKERAKQRGVKLPEEPGPHGKGKEQGNRMGPGGQR
jgi:hypothetical protein